MSAKVKRFILTNIPYLFVFLFFSKLGEGWRLAPGPTLAQSCCTCWTASP